MKKNFEYKKKLKQDKEKQYLNWYYENLVSISKTQTRTAWIVFILCVFSVTIETNIVNRYSIPFSTIEIEAKHIYIFLPVILSLIFWQLLGSLRAAKITVNNMKFRLDNLGFNSNELRLYDIDPSLNFFDLITFNYKEYVQPGIKEKLKRFNWRHLVYIVFIIFFFYCKIIILIKYPVDRLVKLLLFVPFLLVDIYFSKDLVINRINRFINS